MSTKYIPPNKGSTYGMDYSKIEFKMNMWRLGMCSYRDTGNTDYHKELAEKVLESHKEYEILKKWVEEDCIGMNKYHFVVKDKSTGTGKEIHIIWKNKFGHGNFYTADNDKIFL